MAFVAAIPLARCESWAWLALGGSLVVWFVIDSSISVLTGGWFNVVLINLFALIVIAMPLAISWRTRRR